MARPFLFFQSNQICCLRGAIGALKTNEKSRDCLSFDRCRPLRRRVLTQFGLSGYSEDLMGFCRNISAVACSSSVALA